MSILVLEPGVLASIQDPFGRPGWQHLGVPVGGAADAWSARLANRLLGNADGAATIEITLGHASIRFEAATVVAVTGGLESSVDGLSLPAATASTVRAGSTLRLGPGHGLRSYVAVAGGISVASVLGSPSTDLRTGFGGLSGRALRPGDRLQIGMGATVRHQWRGRRSDGPIRIVPGPHADWLVAPGTLDARAWSVSASSDRTGVRLEGDRLEIRHGEVASLGLPLGAIQVPPDGMPIIALADRPVTGGYPVPVVVARADVGRVAQLRPGDEVSLRAISLEEARDALRGAEEELAALEALDAPGDDELGWAGSHE